jgi:PKD repeat protein
MVREKDFEKLFSEKFSDFVETPSEKVWSGIQRKLSISDFFQFSLNSLNIYYVAVTVAGLVGGLLLFNGSEESYSPQDEVQITDTILPELILPENSAQQVHEKSLQIHDESEAIKKSENLRSIRIETPEKKEKIEIVLKDSSVAPEQLSGEIPGKETQSQNQRTAVADFSMSVSEGCGPIKVAFKNISENAIDFKWNFGDGIESNQMNPVYLFNQPGKWIVQLEATDYYGNKSMAYDTVTVKTKPKAQFDFVAESNGFSDAQVYFYNYSKDAVNYFWDFGDGNKSGQMNPTHNYGRRDKYEVKLIAFSNDGCTDTLVVNDIFPDSDYFVRFPSAFSPNPSSPGDGRYSVGDLGNQVFYPVFNGVEHFQIMIFNRSGLKVFESNDIQLGWNGYYRNQLVKPDVYIWRVTGRYRNGKTFEMSGDVTVILRR